jgi:HPt (histidine-containing phosphotransfer) domain-containing protein
MDNQDRPAAYRWEPPSSLASFAAPAQANIMRELIDVFVQDAERQLGLIQAAAAAGDIGALARISHSIKGSAQSMGAASMIELSRSMEEGARLGEQRDYRAEASRLATVFGETRAAMLAWCSRIPA